MNSAILRYTGAADEDPTTPLVDSVNPMNEVNLVPLTNPTPVRDPVTFMKLLFLHIDDRSFLAGRPCPGRCRHRYEP